MATEKPQFVLAYDCDDVIVGDTAYRVVEYYKKIYGFEVDMKKFYGGPEDWGVSTLEEVGKRIEPFFREHGHELVKPDPEAVEAIRYLANHKEIDFESHIVTGRADFMAPHTYRMAEEYFPGIFHGIHHTNFNKYNSTTKGSVCRRIGALALIDDHIAHCQNVLEEGTPHAVVFGEHPWNEMKTLPSSMVRGADWYVTPEEILKIAKSRIEN